MSTQSGGHWLDGVYDRRNADGVPVRIVSQAERDAKEEFLRLSDREFYGALHGGHAAGGWAMILVTGALGLAGAAAILTAVVSALR